MPTVSDFLMLHPGQRDGQHFHSFYHTVVLMPIVANDRLRRCAPCTSLVHWSGPVSLRVMGTEVQKPLGWPWTTDGGYCQLVYHLWSTSSGWAWRRECVGLEEVGLQPQPHGSSWATACGFWKFVSSSNGDLGVDVALWRCGVAEGGLFSPLAGPAGGGSGDLSSALIGPEEEGSLSVRLRVHLSEYCHHYGPVRANASVSAIPS